MLHGTAAQGFSLQTQNYERVRPGYTDEVLEFAVRSAGLGKGEGKHVLDVGAGTGKLTRQLVAHLPHATTVAAEPVAAMREAFQRVLPSVPMVDAAACRLPFEDGSMDCVFVAQAFHWFCDEDSLREMHRVLKPGACLCLIWNMEDEAEPLVAALRDVYERHDAGIPQYRKGMWKEVFRGAWAAQAFERQAAVADSEGPDHRGSLTKDDPASLVLSSCYLRDRSCWATAEQIWQRVLSKSYVAVLAPDQQAQLKHEIMEVIAQHAEAFRPPDAVGERTGKTGGAAAAVVAAASGAVVDDSWVACIPIRTEVVLCRKC